jgi:allantoinase
MSLALRSRRVLTPGGLRPATVVVEGERVTAIHDHAVTHDPALPDAIDLGDRVLMPGIVDTHVHVNEPGRTEWEGWETATAAAALGGVTTLADMPLNSLPVTTTLDALHAKHAAMAGKLRVDCALWGGIVPGNTPQLAPMVAAGVRGFKAFLCPSGIDEFPQAEAPDLLEAMPVLRALGVPLLAHAELELPLSEAAARRVEGGDARDYTTYLHSRPPEWEDAAVALLVDLCRETGCPVHVVHLSSAGALALVRQAKAEGLPFTAETCPHYLCLRAEDVPPGATEFKCAPPIRGAANRERLWAALADGTLDFVVTDHSPCVPGLKLPEEGDFLRAWGGIASLQLGLASVFTEARARGFGIPTLSRWMTAGPARLLGWQHGELAPGMRADLVAWDPDAAWTVDPQALAHKNPITPYAGRRLDGRVTDVWLRGGRIVQQGRLVGEPRGRRWQG